MAEGGTKSFNEGFQGAGVWLDESPSVRWLAQKFGVQPWTLACAGCIWACGFVLWGFTGEIVFTVASLLYPMYASFKALDDDEHQQVGGWLTYWITYAALKLCDTISYRILEWVPFYHLFRLLFLFWLFLPATNGAAWIYKLVVAPTLRSYRPHIDATLDKTADDLNNSIGSLGGNEQFRSALRRATVNAASASAGYVQGLGIEDLVEQQLKKTAAGFAQAPPHHAQDAPSGPASGPTPCRTPSSRARVASPAPRVSPEQAMNGVQGI